MKCVKLALVFLLVGPLVGGLTLALASALVWGDAILLHPLAVPFYYFAGAIPSLLTALGAWFLSRFIRQPLVTVAAGTALGAFMAGLIGLSPGPSAPAEGHQTFLLMMVIVGAAAALPCLLIGYIFGWLERDA